MSNVELARQLHETGRSHALASHELFKAALSYAEEHGIKDRELFAFNGTFSLSIHYLIGLGLELFLKAAYVAHGGQADAKHLRVAIGHDLLTALEMAKAQGFHSEAPHLDELVEHLREPHKAHFFRYDRPNEIALPDVDQTVKAFAVLDDELAAMLYPPEPPKSQL